MPVGALKATTDYSKAVPNAAAVIIVVPLFVDEAGAPDFRWLDSATGDVARNLTSGTLVVYETTLPVGTTRNRWKPALEHGSGLVEGTDFHVGFSPERVLTGRVFTDLRKYPKLVGGLSAKGSETLQRVYEALLEFDERPDLDISNGVWDLGSAEAAELAKLAETTYRDVNIGLANQFARFAETVGINIYKVIEAANSQPFSHIHQPGIAVGGHCIPIYPRLYLAGDPSATIVEAARTANANMPKHAVETLERAYGPLEGARVVIFGAAYRAGVKETAFSGVFPIAETLTRRGAHPVVHDSAYTDAELRALGLTPFQLGSVTDAGIVHTDYPEYAVLSEKAFPGMRIVVDGRAIVDPALHPRMTVKTIGIGE